MYIVYIINHILIQQGQHGVMFPCGDRAVKRPRFLLALLVCVYALGSDFSTKGNQSLLCGLSSSLRASRFSPSGASGHAL